LADDTNKRPRTLSDRQALVEDWICQLIPNLFSVGFSKYLLNEDAGQKNLPPAESPSHITQTTSLKRQHESGDESEGTISQLESPLSTSIDGHKVPSSKDESFPLPSRAITMEDAETPILRPALPHTPPPQIKLNKHTPHEAQTPRNRKKSSPGRVATLPTERNAMIQMMLEHFRSLAKILTLEHDSWITIPAAPVLDDYNFHAWYGQRFGLDKPPALRFHYMDSYLNPFAYPMDTDPADCEDNQFKQNLFVDFVETYKHFQGSLHTYRILVIPEHVVRLSMSRSEYPRENKEQLFNLYHECHPIQSISSTNKSSGSQGQKALEPAMPCSREHKPKRPFPLDLLEPANPSFVGPPPVLGSSQPHGLGTEPGVQLPPLLPPINLPSRKLPGIPGIPGIGSGAFVNRLPPPSDPYIVARVQRVDGTFSAPLHNAPFGSNINTQAFFSWFIQAAHFSSPGIPNLLQISFKDAVPTMDYEIYRGDEREFTRMKCDILPQCRRTVALMSPVSEFVILIRAPHYNVEVS
jgi:hypothetical protein